ncbi:MAG: hypothetical protein V1751_02355 [Pseudomonadota bacterium]
MNNLTRFFLIAASSWAFFLPFDVIYFVRAQISFAADEIASQGISNDGSKNRDRHDRPPQPQPSKLTPAQLYAGEILSYLLQVVLGQAGELSLRKDWRTRGIHENLDFSTIVEVMTQSEKNQHDVMVLDPNILDLTRTLYYYDERLSLYKGDFSVASVYPAPEFIAIRLLLLQKIDRAEKVDFEALIDRERLLLNQDAAPSPEDLNAMNLRPDELKLLREIIRSEPHIYKYLRSPFLIKAFYEAGAIAGGESVKQSIREASYRRYPCRRFRGSDRRDALKILFLPSMTMDFYHGDSHASLSQHGFKPSEFFDKMAKKLAEDILSSTKIRVREEIIKPGNGKSEISMTQWNKLWAQIVKENISFYIEDERPLVIYPENAEQVIREVCPEADFTVILLGKNVYRTIYFDKTRDIYPFADRLYIDIMDIKHSETEEEMEKVGDFICSRLNNHIRGRIARETASTE